MADDLRGRLEILKEIENAEARIDRARKSNVLTQLDINKYVDEQKKKVRELGKELRTANLERIKGFAAEESSLKSMGSIYDDLAKKDRERILAQVKSTTLTAPQEAALSRMSEINRDLAQLGRDDTLQQAALLEEYNQQKGVLSSIGAENQHIVQNLNEQNELAKTHSKLTTKQKDFLQKQKNVYDGIKDTIGGILETASLLTSTVGGVLGGALIGASTAGKKLLDTSYQLGGSLTNTSNIATTLFGTVFEDAVGTTKGLSKEFGGLNDVSLQTQLRTNVLAKNLGIGAGEAARLTGSFARLNDGSAETAQNLIQSTQNLAQANGLVPNEVMADVANSAEEFALYGKDGGKNIAEAAVAAGKLGVSMKTLSGITDNLLDFESSINAELELGAMLGRNINLDRARALAYEGDIGGSVRETLSALGGIEEFNRMDYFQKKQTAALLGVSVEEFQKMADNADKLNKDGSIQVSQYESLVNNAKAFGSQILSAGQGLGGVLIATGQIKDGWGSIGGIFGGLKDKIGGIFGGTKDAAMDAFSAAKAKGLSDKQILSGFGGKEAKDMMMDKGKDLMPDAGDLTEGANPAKKGGMMDSMSKIDMNAVLKGAAAMVIVAAAVFVFGKAVQEFMKVSWEAVGMAVVSMLALVGAVALLGAIMMSGVGAVAILAGAAAMLVIAASVLVLGYALQAIGTGFEMMSTGIQSLMPQLMAVATTIGGLVVLIPSIALLAYSIMGLSASLVAFGVAGLLAAPGLMALTAVGAVSTGLNTLLGGGEEGGGSDSDLLNEIRGLREDLNNGKVAVYMDGQKVTAGVSRVVSRVGSNSYAT
jgi:hypothetical protein